MSRRSRQQRRREEDLYQGLAALAVLAWPTISIYLKPRIWMLVLAAISIAGLLTAIFIVRAIISKKRTEEERRTLKTIQHWQRLSPSGFEKHVAALFEARGYKAHLCGGTADGGIDIELSRNGMRGIVQCKRYTKNVGVKAIREFSAVASRAKGAKAYFVTTSRFSRDALEWVKREPITLVDGDKLIEWTKELHFGAYATPLPRPSVNLIVATLVCLVFGVGGMVGLLLGVLIRS